MMMARYREVATADPQADGVHVETFANCAANAVYCSITASDVHETLPTHVDVQLQCKIFIEEEEACF